VFVCYSCTYNPKKLLCHRPWNRSSRTNWLNSTENRSTPSTDSTLVDSVDRLDFAENRSTPSTRFPLFIGLFIFRCTTLVEQRVFQRHVCLSVTTMYCAHGVVTRQLADMPTREITWSLCKNDWTDRVAIFLRVDWPRPVSFCVRWVSHPKSAVRDVSWRRSLLVIKYFAALYLTNGSSRRMVKIEHYTVLRRQRCIVNGLLQVGLPRVLEYSLVLDFKKYSSNVLVLEYSFNSSFGRKFQFPVTVLQINKQLLELYANLAPSPSSCELGDLIHWKLHCSLYQVIVPYLLLLSAVMTCNLY